MSSIIIPDAVRLAVAERPELAATLENLRIRAAAQLLVDNDRPQHFAVGNSSMWPQGVPARFSTPGSNCTPGPQIPGCFGPDNQRLCDMNKVSRGIIVQGGQPFTLQMEPTNAQWIQPRAVRATVVDAENSDINHRVLFTAVTVNDAPIEPTNVPAPTAPALVNGTNFNGWWSDDWQDPDTYAVGVPWPKFSDLNSKMPLRLIGLAMGLPSNTFVAVTVTIYGNPATAQPPGGGNGMVP